MDLSMLIKENTAFDTVGAAMKLFAAAELDLVQNKSSQALEKLDQVEKNFPHHSLTDDIWWRKADLKMKQGNFDQALVLLQRIQDEFAEDVLADDASFLQAEIYERHLHNRRGQKEISHPAR
jgi:outer membrane protein assembly factor BamD (BamD/ComL family)